MMKASFVFSWLGDCGHLSFKICRLKTMLSYILTLLGMDRLASMH